MRKLKIGDRVRATLNSGSSRWILYEKRHDGMFCIGSDVKAYIGKRWVIHEGNIDTFEDMMKDGSVLWSWSVESDKWDKHVEKMKCVN